MCHFGAVLDTALLNNSQHNEIYFIQTLSHFKTHSWVFLLHETAKAGPTLSSVVLPPSIMSMLSFDFFSSVIYLSILLPARRVDCNKKSTVLCVILIHSCSLIICMFSFQLVPSFPLGHTSTSPSNESLKRH